MTPPRWLVVIGFWIPFAVATYAAFAPEGVPMPFRISDVILHAAAFTYLTAALWFAHHNGERAWKPVFWMVAYGVAIEAIQSFEPTRSAEFKDLFVDAVGISFGVLVYRFVVARLFANARLPNVPITGPSRPQDSPS